MPNMRDYERAARDLCLFFTGYQTTSSVIAKLRNIRPQLIIIQLLLCESTIQFVDLICYNNALDIHVKMRVVSNSCIDYENGYRMIFERLYSRASIDGTFRSVRFFRVNQSRYRTLRFHFSQSSRTAAVDYKFLPKCSETSGDLDNLRFLEKVATNRN